jgi:hypothetical protein
VRGIAQADGRAQGAGLAAALAQAGVTAYRAVIAGRGHDADGHEASEVATAALAEATPRC